MPSIDENRRTWAGYDWSAGGEEWSRAWGSPDHQWWGSLLPRLCQFVPANTILEIGPGYGRWTRYLLPLCERLIGVDLTARCVEACRESFADQPHASFYENDGRSLEAVGDEAIDFAVSIDSLVHCERDVLEAYVHELALKLSAGGAAFIHHSNLGAYADPETGELPFPNPQARGVTMTARLFVRFCEEAGLRCIVQELVTWGPGDALNDCFSTITRPGSRFARDKLLLENRGLADEGAPPGKFAFPSLASRAAVGDGWPPWDLHFTPAASVVDDARSQLLGEGRIRDATILSALARGGLRPREVCSVRWRDVQRDRLVLADRVVPVRAELAEDLEPWRQASEPSSRRLVFPGREGGAWRPGEWTAWRQAVCAPLADRHGVPTLEPAVLRHFFAATLLDDGEGPAEVAVRMGLTDAEVAGLYGPWLARPPGLHR
jgi:SAM-dependent methyltransferase